LIEVGPLEERDAITLYLRRASQANRDEAKEVYKLVGGHPFYLLVMAEARRQNESVAQRYRRLLTSVTGGLYLYVNYILSEDLGSRVTETHYAKILRTLAQGEKKFSEIAKGLGTKAEWLTRYVTKLAEFDLVEKTNGAYKLKDRIVRDYFAFNYQEDAASPASDAKAT
jgi:DNA-binding MarR family transcriptional regulator